MTKFQSKFISIKNTELFSPIVNDYIEEDDKLSSLYSFKVNKENIKSVIDQKSCEIIDRNILHDEIIRQYNDLTLSQKLSDNLEKLKSNNTFSIVTAHQPCVFLGPMYFTFKICSAIKTAQILNEEYDEFNFVPVFWIGGEDHDFEEINHINLFGRKLEWNRESGGPVGRMRLENIDDQVEQLEELLGIDSKTFQLIKKYYRSDLTLTQATRSILNELFGRHGLIIIDQDSEVLKSHIKGMIKSELLEERSNKAIQSSLDYLEENYKVQAFSRSINLFYLEDSNRSRIEANENMYSVLNTEYSFSQEEMLAELDDHPDHFSPNVILRPLYQQKLLPAVSYIGGPGELAYWLQLKSVFQSFGVCFPMLILRDCAMIIDKNINNKIDKLSLQYEDIFKDKDKIIKDFLGDKDLELDLSDEKNRIATVFSELKEKLKNLDQGLAKSVEAEERKIEKSLENLESKIVRAHKRNNEDNVKRIENIKSKLFPANSSQERFDSILSYLDKYGIELLDILIESFDPFDKQYKVLIEQKDN